jgi:hypothetical protein
MRQIRQALDVAGIMLFAGSAVVAIVWLAATRRWS